MICQGCLRWSRTTICDRCRAELRLAADRILPGGVRAIAGFSHTGVAARMMHSLKYRAVDAILDPVVEVVAPRLSPGQIYVAVPRAWSRWIRYGIDPAAHLAQRLAAATSGSVATPLRRPWHHARRAGRDHDRPAAPISSRVGLNKPVVVVDDVLTTGATVLAVIAAIGLEMTSLVVTATSAGGRPGVGPRGGPGVNRTGV